jgi:threonine dehydrogenase-like Zn-dependent dehydrogenase
MHGGFGMKAIAVFPATREVKLIDHEEPQITRPTEAKVRMLEVGVCGTDKEICRFEYGTPPQGSDYLIIGHESLGEVVEVGSAVDGLHAGDLVVTMVRRPCPHPKCRACRTGHPDFCSTGDYAERGIKELHGFMAEYVVDDAEYMCVVPQALHDVAVLVEPSTIAAKALLQTLKILQRFPWFDPSQLPDPKDRSNQALVLGAGAVGLLGAMGLRNAGFETFVYDRAPAPNPKSRLVESFGATYVCEQSANQFAHMVGAVELVYEATGASQLAFQAMRVLGHNSIFIFTGVPALGAAKSVDIDTIMRNAVLKNQVILGTVNAGKDAFEAAIRALGAINQRWPAAVQALITGRYPLDAYGDLLLGQPSGIKNVLAFEAIGAQEAGIPQASARA